MRTGSLICRYTALNRHRKAGVLWYLADTGHWTGPKEGKRHQKNLSQGTQHKLLHLHLCSLFPPSLSSPLDGLRLPSHHFRAVFQNWRELRYCKVLFSHVSCRVTSSRQQPSDRGSVWDSSLGQGIASLFPRSRTRAWTVSPRHGTCRHRCPFAIKMCIT